MADGGLSSGIAHPCGDEGLCGRGGCCGRCLSGRLDDGLELSEHHDAVVSLLEAGAHDLKLNLLSFLDGFKVGISNVEIPGQQHLDGCDFGVDSNLTLQSDWHTEDLAGMGHTDIGLELDGIFQPALDEVGAPQGMLEHRDTAGLEISLCSADALILVAELGEKTGFDVALEKFRVDVDIPDESTTFKERITHTACSY
jgi:hypothetical protein